MELESRTKRTLHVMGLDAAVTAELLQAAFVPFGDIVSMDIPIDMLTRKWK